jgi:hypothetical protein
MHSVNAVFLVGDTALNSLGLNVREYGTTGIIGTRMARNLLIE